MEDTCQLKTGMFVLKSCGNPAQYICIDCERSVCQQHIRDSEGHALCVECYGRTHQAHRFKVKGGSRSHFGEEDDLDYYMSDLWYYAIRSDYYGRHESYAVFDSNDYEVFEQQGQADFLDDSDNGSLFDS